MLTCVPVTRSPGSRQKQCHPFTGPSSAHNGCSELTPSDTCEDTPSTAPPFRSRRVQLRVRKRAEWAGTPSQQWPFCRQTRFLFFLFFSHCQIQFCTQFTSSFFSPPLFFRQRQKSFRQRRPSFKLNHPDTEWIVVFVCFSSFQLGPGSQVSHTVEHVWERREAN